MCLRSDVPHVHHISILVDKRKFERKHGGRHLDTVLRYVLRSHVLICRVCTTLPSAKAHGLRYFPVLAEALAPRRIACSPAGHGGVRKEGNICVPS